MTTCDVGTAKLLTPAQQYTVHAVVFQDSIGLPSTDDPLIGEKVVNLVKKIGKGEDHNP